MNLKTETQKTQQKEYFEMEENREKRHKKLNNFQTVFHS